MNGVNDITLRVKGVEYSSTSYESAHKNDVDSNMKTYLENWYNNNLKSYDSKISKETIYCNNRIPSTKNSGSYTNEGYGIHPTIYDYEKFFDWQGTRKGPNLICSQNNDQFSVSSTSGNGELTNPIGLITADEVNMAGGRTSSQNRLYYLYSGTSYWTISPAIFSDWFHVRGFCVPATGELSINNVDFSDGVRPVINLDSSNLVFTGTGTMQDPYVIAD